MYQLSEDSKVTVENVKHFVLEKSLKIDSPARRLQKAPLEK